MSMGQKFTISGRSPPRQEQPGRLSQGGLAPLFKLCSINMTGSTAPPPPSQRSHRLVREEGTGHGWVQAPRARLLATPHRPVHPPPRPIWDATSTWHSGQKQPADGPRKMSPARLGRITGAHRGEEWGDLRPWAGGTPRQATPGEHVLGEGPSPWPQRPDTHQAPPECVRVGIKVIVLPLLCQVHQK